MAAPFRFSTKSFALLLIVALSLATGWATRGPREPVYRGKPLSWWFTEHRQNQSTERLDRAALMSLGPGALAWLIDQARQARVWNPEELRPDASWNERWRLRLLERVSRDMPTRADRVHFEAIVALGKMGADAAPAIPVLLKAVRDGDNDDRLVAAECLASVGSAAWPAVAEAVRHGDYRQRRVLLRKLDVWWTPDLALPPASVSHAQLVELLLPLLRDPDAEVRGWAEQWLRAFAKVWRYHPELEVGVSAIAASLPTLDRNARINAMVFLCLLERAAAAAVPALITQSANPDPIIRIRALATFAVSDPNEPRWVELLSSFRDSADREQAELAEQSLTYAGR